MATKKAGGVIRPRISGTFEATAAVAVGDPVRVTGPYECQKHGGTATPCVGQVSAIRKDVPATGGNRTATVPGDVTVELFGWGILTFKSAGALATAGVEVGVDANGRIAAVGAGVRTIGVLLTTATAIDQDVDVLCNQG